MAPARAWQDLDNHHCATAARAQGCLRLRCAVMCRFDFGGFHSDDLRISIEQLPDQRHLGSPMTVGQEAVVADALKAIG